LETIWGKPGRKRNPRPKFEGKGVYLKQLWDKHPGKEKGTPTAFNLEAKGVYWKKTGENQGRKRNPNGPILEDKGVYWEQHFGRTHSGGRNPNGFNWTPRGFLGKLWATQGGKGTPAGPKLEAQGGFVAKQLGNLGRKEPNGPKFREDPMNSFNPETPFGHKLGGLSSRDLKQPKFFPLVPLTKDSLGVSKPPFKNRVAFSTNFGAH